MNRFTLAIASIGLFIVAIAKFLAENGVACTKIAARYTAERAAVGAGWLAEKLQAAATRVDAAKRIQA